METQKLIDKFTEIKLIVEDLYMLADSEVIDSSLTKIDDICENVIIDWKVEKRLNDETRA